MANLLSEESSPYLLQHADNPVHWRAWDDAALQAARSSQKPILLSIGYSSCHWCHVMAHESFADPATAAVMNEHYVNIKVDREERPDLDKIYQAAHQLLTQNQGGWPLTMFLDPDTLVPFFGGTYFPSQPRYGLPAFQDLLMRVSQAFNDQRDSLQEQGAKISEVMAALVHEPSAATLEDTVLLQAARDGLGQQYDSEHGGFGSAPKFPMPSAVDRVLKHWAYSTRTPERDRHGLDMVMFTLTRMARGGIFDHLGGGFCRYATDRKWMIPHFEKMLYDNGQLLCLYADALAIGPDPLFEATVRETATWLLREMRHPDGAFFAALDADSEGEEGKYYVWRREQVKKLLNEDEYLLIETLYGLDKPANFENKWNLYRTDSWRSVVSRLSMEETTAAECLAASRARLLAERETRERPGCDDKILTAWNGLAIKGLARAGLVLGESAWIDAAQGAADFVREQLTVDGELRASWRVGTAKHAAYLDDYAFLLDGLLTLLSARWSEATYAYANTLAQTLIDQFEDTENGGFYFTSHSHEQVITRLKPTLDDATPAGNGIAANALAQLGHLTGEVRYIDAASRTLEWARTVMEKLPSGHSSLLAALEQQLYSPETVILRGPAEQLAPLAPWQQAANNGYKPWRSVYAIPYEGVSQQPDYLPRMVSLEQREKVTAYVCRDLTCSLPITDLVELESALQ